MPCPGDPGPRPHFIPIPETAKAVMRYSAYGQTIENVFFFTRSGGYGALDLGTLGAQMLTQWTAHLRAMLPSVLQLEDITVTDQSVISGAQSITPVATAGSSATGPVATTGVTWALKFGTGRSGRSYRGRMYWPLLTANSIVANQIDATVAAVFLTHITAFFNDIFAATGDIHVVASYQNNCAWRLMGVATPVTSYTYTDRNPDSQRRRLPGRGI